jgi:hypothetical protein
VSSETDAAVVELEPADIDLGCTGDDPAIPSQHPAYSVRNVLIGVLAIGLVIVVIVIASALRATRAADAGIAPVRTFDVRIQLNGALDRFDVSGPITRTGTTSTELPSIPAGARISAVAINTVTGVESSCSITVIGRVVSGRTASGGASVCVAVVTPPGPGRR